METAQSPNTDKGEREGQKVTNQKEQILESTSKVTF